VSIEWDRSGFDAVTLSASVRDHVIDALEAGGKVILEDALTKVPEESGDLASTGKVAPDRGGDNTVGIVFSSVYARYIHEHLGFKHPHGGQAKFLEAAMIEKADEAMQAIADDLQGHL
jgi:hypothetical protein